MVVVHPQLVCTCSIERLIPHITEDERVNDSDSLEHFAEVVDSVINANFRAGNDGDSQGTDSNQRNDSDQSVSSGFLLTVEE